MPSAEGIHLDHPTQFGVSGYWEEHRTPPGAENKTIGAMTFSMFWFIAVGICVSLDLRHYPIAFGVLLLIGLVLTLRFIDDFVQHYANITKANYQIPDESQNHWSSIWESSGFAQRLKYGLLIALQLSQRNPSAEEPTRREYRTHCTSLGATFLLALASFIIFSIFVVKNRMSLGEFYSGVSAQNACLIYTLVVVSAGIVIGLLSVVFVGDQFKGASKTILRDAWKLWWKYDFRPEARPFVLLPYLTSAQRIRRTMVYLSFFMGAIALCPNIHDSNAPIDDIPILEALVLMAFAFSAPIAVIGLLSYRALLFHSHTYNSHQSTLLDQSRQRWAVYAKRLKNSSNPNASDHIFLGINYEGDYPVLLPVDVLKRHAHIVGATGSGKTHRAIAPMFSQLIDREASVLFVDLKGDHALFETARLEAQKRGLPFKWFTNVTGAPTFGFNPLQQRSIEMLPPEQKAEWLFTSMSLDYGEGYGRSYFALGNLLAPNALFVNRPEVASFRAMEANLVELARESRKSNNRLTQEGFASVHGMAQVLAPVEALNCIAQSGPSQDDEVFGNRIDMADLVSKRSVYYFYLDPSAGSHAMRHIAKMALYSLVRSAKQFGAGRQIYVFLDEFQHIVSRDLRNVLEQARSAGVGVILSNQSYSQLSDGDQDFTSIILDNTQLNMIFSVGDPNYSEMISKMSGEAIFSIDVFEKLADKPGLSSGGKHETRSIIAPRYSRNDLMHLGADEALCLTRVVPNLGFCQYDGMPFRLETDFHISKGEFDARTSAQWPNASSYKGAHIPKLSSSNVAEQLELKKKQARTPFEQRLLDFMDRDEG